jgi:O-methyltransferase
VDGARAPGERAALLYLDLLKRALTRTLAPEPYAEIDPLVGSWKRVAVPLRRGLRLVGLDLVRVREHDPRERLEGRDHPPGAETMIGLRRLDSLQECIVDVLGNDVPGDLFEAGVWRGGSAIFMRGALEAFGDEERTVWAADSYAGLPKPDAGKYPLDAGDRFWRNPHLAVPLSTVRENFRRYGLLDDRVRFLEGWFEDTLPAAPVERISVLRLDGDMYGSTIVALEALYSKLSVGGYAIVDDYGAVPACRAAVDDFREAHDISEELVTSDWTGVYWRRER